MAGSIGMDGGRGNGWRVVLWGGAAGLMLIPAIAMQFTREVAWGAEDFLTMGAMLLVACGAFEVAMRLTRSTLSRSLAGIAILAGSKPAAAVVIGSCLSLSSTAIVIEVLSNQRRLSTAVGRTSFSILLAQDIAVVPILLFVSFLGNSVGGSVIGGLVLAVTNAALITPSGAVTGGIGFDAFGDTHNPVLTAYRVENRHWVPLDLAATAR